MLPVVRHILRNASLLEHVKLLFSSSVEGDIFDVANAYRNGRLYEDSAATTLAVPGGVVGAIRGEMGRYLPLQATGASKAILQSDGHRYWMETDGTKQLSFTLNSALGNVVMIAAIRPASVSGTQAIISNFTNSDADGQSELQLLDTAARYLYRRAGGNQAPSAGTLSVGVDAVVDGQYSAALTQGVVGVNGIDGAASTPLAKVGNGMNVQLLARGTSGNPFTGRVYSMAIVGVPPSTSAVSALRRWAAKSAGMSF